jgi:hypothetical protein
MWRCEGPHCFVRKRPRTFASALQSVAAVEVSKNLLSRDFWCCSIFDFATISVKSGRVGPEPRLPLCPRERTCAALIALTPWPRSTLYCDPHHAVLIAPGLRLGSFKNGNISYVGWRLWAISPYDCSNLELRDGAPIGKSPQLAGPSAMCASAISG